MKKRVLITIMITVLAMILSLSSLVGCAGDNWTADSEWNNSAPSATPNAPPNDGNGGNGGGQTPPQENPNPHDGITTPNRLVVYTANFTIHTNNFGETLLFLRSTINRDMGEWFDRQDVQYHDRHAVLVARVASSRLYDFIDEIIDELGMGAIRHHDINATDVSLAHRDRTLAIQEEERHLEWLHQEMERAIAQNQTFAQRQTIQTQINQAQTRLNTLITAQNTVNQQIHFSVVTITLRESYPSTPEPTTPESENEEDEEPSRTAIAFSNAWTVISSILIGMLYVLAVLLPLGAVVVPAVFLIKYLIKKERAKQRELAIAEGRDPDAPKARRGYKHPIPQHINYYQNQSYQPQSQNSSVFNQTSQSTEEKNESAEEKSE